MNSEGGEKGLPLWLRNGVDKAEVTLTPYSSNDLGADSLDFGWN